MTLQASDTAERIRQGDVSYLSLWVPDVARAATFFSNVLGWRYADSGPAESRLVEGTTISHGIAELHSAAGFMRQFGVPLPEQLAPTTYAVFVVDDINAAVERVRDAGGWAGTPFRQPYGLMAPCIDDQGLPFSLQQAALDMPAPRSPAAGTRHGDVAYLVFEVPDADRARAFLGRVFGLEFSPGRGPGGWNITDLRPMAGLVGGQPRSLIVPTYRVDDIRVAVEQVRAAAGTASEPAFEGYGTRAACADDQGTRFMLVQF